eukprot:XP_003731317.1 PREDICTED: scavenger receptor cysteine-rich domain superfamily protein [Strongylocentrotus purpuratus]
MVGSDFTEQGRLEVFLKGEWGYVAAGYYSSIDRYTVCRHLGYAGAFYTYRSEFARSSRPILIDDISCGDNDMKITDCYILELSGPNSTRIERDEVSALCFPYESVANHPVRFRDENGVINRNYGVIEIYHDGIWGPICDSYFYQHEILCSQLGHTDLTMGGSLSNYDGKYTSNGPMWFRLSYCPRYSGLYGFDHDKIYECRHGPWGKPDPDDCSRDNVATARCVYMDQTDDYYPDDYYPDEDVSWPPGLGGWEVFLVAIAVVVPMCIIIGCCYRSRRSQTIIATGAPPATYTSATNATHIDGVSSESTDPAPPYVPASPAPVESPPTYDSVTAPMTQTDNTNA